MLRPHPGIVEAGGNRMGRVNLTAFILKEVAERAMEDAGYAPGQRRRMLTAFEAPASALDTDQPDESIVNKRMEDPHSIGPPADARDHRGRQPSRHFEHLGLGFATDDGLEVANHSRVRGRPDNRA